MTTDPEQIQRDIEQTRDELGRTVEELSERLDVKKQAQQRIDAAKDAARRRVTYVKQNARAQPQLPAIVAVGLAALLAAGLWRRRRR